MAVSRSLLLAQSVVETGDTIQYTYDETGNRASMTDESGVYRLRHGSVIIYDKKKP
jgi:YD repeat-containing protein